jgi:hypothetical protein
MNNLHHHLNTKYILSHLADLDFYINTPIDAYKYLSQVKFKKDFPFSFVGW